MWHWDQTTGKVFKRMTTGVRENVKTLVGAAISRRSTDGVHGLFDDETTRPLNGARFVSVLPNQPNPSLSVPLQLDLTTADDRSRRPPATRGIPRPTLKPNLTQISRKSSTNTWEEHGPSARGPCSGTVVARERFSGGVRPSFGPTR